MSVVKHLTAVIVLAVPVSLAASELPAAPPGIVETVQTACRPLCLHEITAPEVARALGQITVDHGAPAQVELKPKDQTFSSADVLRDGVTHQAVAVSFFVSDNQKVSVSSLIGAFGPIEETLRRVARGYSIVFEHVVEVNSDCSCRMTAEIVPHGKYVDDAAVTKLTISQGDK